MLSLFFRSMQTLWWCSGFVCNNLQVNVIYWAFANVHYHIPSATTLSKSTPMITHTLFFQQPTSLHFRSDWDHFNSTQVGTAAVCLIVGKRHHIMSPCMALLTTETINHFRDTSANEQTQRLHEQKLESQSYNCGLSWICWI